MAFEISRHHTLAQRALCEFRAVRIDVKATNALDLVWLEVRNIRGYAQEPERLRVAFKKAQGIMPDHGWGLDNIMSRFDFYQCLVDLMGGPSDWDYMAEKMSALENRIDNPDIDIDLNFEPSTEEKFFALLNLSYWKRVRDVQLGDENKMTRDYFKEAQALALESGSLELQAYAYFFLGETDREKGSQHIEKGLALARQSGDLETLGTALFLMSRHRQAESKIDEGIKLLTEALDAYTKNAQILEAAEVEFHLARALIEKGGEHDGVVRLNHALEVVEDFELPLTVSQYWHGAQELYEKTGHLELVLCNVEKEYARNILQDKHGYFNPNLALFRRMALERAAETCDRMGAPERAEAYRKRAEDHFTYFKPLFDRS